MRRYRNDQKLYIHLNNDEKHLAKSRRTAGAVSGMDLDNRTGKGCGAAEFVEYGMTEKEYRRAEFISASLGPIIEGAVHATGDVIMDHAERVIHERVRPKIEEAVIKFRHSTGFWGKAIWDGITGSPTKAEQILEEQTINLQTSTTVFVKDEVEPQNRQPISMETYEAIAKQNRMLVTALARNIRFLANTYVSEEDNKDAYILWNANWAEIATQETMDTLRFFLNNKQQCYLDCSTEVMFSEFLAGNLIIDGKAVPVCNRLEKWQ